MAFRMETAYGDPGAVPRPEDLVDFLVWTRAMRHKGRLHAAYHMGNTTTR